LPLELFSGSDDVMETNQRCQASLQNVQTKRVRIKKIATGRLLAPLKGLISSLALSVDKL